MAKKMKKTVPTKAPSKVLTGGIEGSMDPLEAPSRSTKIMDGVEKAPKGTITAGEAEENVDYVNFEKTPRMVRIVPNKELAANKIRKIQFWSGPGYGWAECTVPFAYPLILATNENTPYCAKPQDPEVAAAARKARAAHLPKFKKTKPDPTPEKADGKRVFKGKLNGKNVLFDSGDGSTVATLEAGVALADGAKKVKRDLVSQKDATPYAMWVFTKAWNEQK